MRTLNRWTRVYIDGYDLSGYSRSIGPLASDYEPVDVTADLGDSVRGYLCNTPEITPSTLNAIFDDTAATGLHAVMSTPASRTLMAPIGMQAEPVMGDPVFVGQYHQLAMRVHDDSDAVVATIPFGGWDANALTNYSKAWGVLLHENSAEVAINDQAGVDDAGGETAAGGYMVYQVFGGDGTATLLVEDAPINDDADFDPLVDATTGVIDCAVRSAGIVQIGTAATVRQYLRWQIEFDAANTVTFALAFVRGQ
jgi:hypothetical protein